MLLVVSACSLISSFTSFFYNCTATPEIYTLSLHDALPICVRIIVTEDVLEEEESIRPQDPGDLADRGRNVGEVMRRDAAGDEVERAIPEGQPFCLRGEEVQIGRAHV